MTILKEATLTEQERIQDQKEREARLISKIGLDAYLLFKKTGYLPGFGPNTSSYVSHS